MPPPKLSPDEPLRLAALRRLNMMETPLEERFERITRLARQFLRVKIAAVSLVEADRQWFKSIQGLNECATSRADSFCGHTILEADVLVVRDARQDPRFADNPLVTGPPHIVYYAACPIRSIDGMNIGALCVIDTAPRDPSEEELQCLRDLAALAQSEIQSASANAVQAALVEDVSLEHRRALIDSLTRMWNRDGILRLAEEAIDAVQSGSHGAALVMVDLDRFKEANDGFGHAAGDEVLRVCARRMLGALRETDMLGRLGGDEFLLVLTPCESSEAAMAVASRVRARLTSSVIRTEAGEIPMTASIGVTFVAPNSSIVLDSVIKSADAALYDAKRAGRDRASLSSAIGESLGEA